MQRRLIALTAAAISALVIAVGCSSSTDSAGRPPASSTGARGDSSNAAVSGTVVIFAAASLKEAFTTLGKQFQSVHPGTIVKLSFGASSDLAEQINQGAPADVFASASPKNMKQVLDAGGASTSTDFVKNVMEVAVPPSNPGGVTSVTDLGKSGVKLALCQPEVPCGAIATEVFKKAKITVKPVTLEADVKTTLSKVELNEVDAGVVYATDVRAAGSKVKGIVIPDNLNASTEYPIAALAKAPNATGAQAFVAYVLSPAGQSVLSADGFQKP
jgi:molybdate transport system substrate-binding protein